MLNVLFFPPEQWLKALWAGHRPHQEAPALLCPAPPSCVSGKVSHFWAGFFFWLLCLQGNK